ncbi:MAG: helix-hairpin-helix domain-containing protein [Bacilli bacterium]|nr:helix-hairpin-helix domain-containing protein [Bacilli bacterium]MDD4795225.1 helix-hairpin-helix domain-containing protein [Bacilli bacterium]
MINLILSLNIMFCDIKGAVKNPGVYEINNNNIYEIINLAGGPKKDASLSLINLSKKVTDEMVIYIPSTNDRPKKCPICICPKVECPTPEITTPATTALVTTKMIMTTTKPVIPTTTYPQTSKVSLININLASKVELISLNGIGDKIADAIIEYRIIAPFTFIEDIMNVKGVGEVVFAKIKSFITV